MKTRTIEIFSFDELSDSAKERARYWFRSGDEFDPEFIRDEFVELLTATGFLITEPRYDRAIFWNTNPIEAAFNASWSASRVDVPACAKLCADRPNDKETHRIVATLIGLATRFPDATGTAECGTNINQSAEYDTGITDDTSDAECNAVLARQHETDAYAEFAELVRDLAHEFAKAVNAEYEYQNSDDCVDENIRANDYEFLSDGTRA